MNKIKKLLEMIRSGDAESRNLAINMLLSGACKPVSIIVSYIYVPIVMSYLGVEKYGIWATILSILSWISYFDIGIGNGLRNKLTESIANRETDRGRKLISSTYAIIAFIMIVLTIVLCGACQFVNWYKVFGIATSSENLANLVSISIIFVASNFILSICKNILYALQRASVVSFMELGVQLLNLLGVLAVGRFSSGNLMLMACVYGGSMLMVNIIASIVMYSKHNELIPSIRAIDVHVGFDLTNLGIQFFIIQICALVLFTTDNLIISGLYGAVNVTPYTTVNKLFNVISHAFTALLAPVWSSVTKAKAERNYKWLSSLVKRLNYLMVPFFCGIVLLALIFKPLSNIWLGRELDYQHGLILFGAMYCALTIWCNTYAYIANGLELMKMSIFVAITQAVVNIPLSLFFAEIMEYRSAGVLIGTVLSMVISAVITPVYVYKCINDILNPPAMLGRTE